MSVHGRVLLRTLWNVYGVGAHRMSKFFFSPPVHMKRHIHVWLKYRRLWLKRPKQQLQNKYCFGATVRAPRFTIKMTSFVFIAWKFSPHRTTSYMNHWKSSVPTHTWLKMLRYADSVERSMMICFASFLESSPSLFSSSISIQPVSLMKITLSTSYRDIQIASVIL